MQNVNSFLDSNPTEVIVFIYQVNSAVDQPVDLNAFYNQMSLVDGFLDKLYVHSGTNTSWPTLGELTDPATNKVSEKRNRRFWNIDNTCFSFMLHVDGHFHLLQRVIMFHYNGPDCNQFPEECPSGLHWYYNYASDNDWDHRTVSSVTDTDTSCALRANGGGNPVEWIGLNNFIIPPSKDAAQKLNAYDTAKAYVDVCSSILNNDINFFITDFWEQGELPRMTQDYNRRRAIQQQRALQTQQRKLLRSQA